MFFIRSSEPSFCPVCGSRLRSRDSVIRNVIPGDGHRIRLRIRRLSCPKCRSVHRELPDFVQPFKHYESKVIQKVIDGDTFDCPAEDSTMNRWLNEYKNASDQVNGALTSLWMKLRNMHRELLSGRSLLNQIRQIHTDNWYSFVSTLLVNAGYGTYTQFASGPP